MFFVGIDDIIFLAYIDVKSPRNNKISNVLCWQLLKVAKDLYAKITEHMKE